MMKSILIDKVFDFTEKKTLFSAPCRVVLGLSGGADSMALLHILTHWPQTGLEVAAIHIHHGLRGKAADEDAEFVKSYCSDRNIPLTVIYADVPAIAAERHLSIEEAGRKVRYAEFEALRQKINADYVVTAHTASDQAETVLMHLIRGCGVDGLAGIPAVRGCIRRPLLCCDRSEIEAYCDELGIPYRTDETNADLRYARNDIRHRVLPGLQELNPAIDEALLRLSQSAEADSRYLCELADSALATAKCTYGYRRDDFAKQASVVRRRMIRRLFVQSGLSSYEEAHILAAEQAILNGCGSVSLPGQYRLDVRQGLVTLYAVDRTPAALTTVDVQTLPAKVTFGPLELDIRIMTEPIAENVHKMFAKSVLDYDKISGDVYVRARQEGDYIHPEGRGIGKSIKKLMNEWCVPAYLRDSYPLLCDASGVIMVPGYACDEKVAVTESTKHYLVCQVSDVQG